MAGKKRKWVFAGILLLFTAGILILICRHWQKNPGMEKTQETETEAKEEKPEIDTIVMTYQTLEISKTDDLDRVLEEINKISREEIGVEVELKVSSATDSFTDYPLWISQGDRIDLMILNYQDITGYIKTGMIQPLDDLLDRYGAGIKKIIADGEDVTQGSVFQGKAYGVTNVYESNWTGGGLWISGEVIDAAGISYQEDHIYSLTEIDRILKKLKAKYPGCYPLGQITSGTTSTTYSYYCGMDENISGGYGTGVLKDGKICDFYETEDYYNFLMQMRDWYEKGYIFPDGAFTDESQKDLFQAGMILSKPFISEPGMADELMCDDLVCLKTTEVYYNERDEKSGFWVIPSTSGNPEAAMKFLNLMLTDVRIGNLFTWGIEGEHYVVSDDGTINYPDNTDITTVSYCNPMGLYGDYSQIYRMQSRERREELEKYAKKVTARDEIYEDFVYDKTNVADKAVVVQSVLKKFIPVLESGSVDLEIYYPKFIEELKQAGMDEIIEDKQRQLDEYLAKEKDSGQ